LYSQVLGTTTVEVHIAGPVVVVQEVVVAVLPEGGLGPLVVLEGGLGPLVVLEEEPGPLLVLEGGG
jgi:hypothetical protein